MLSTLSFVTIALATYSRFVYSVWPAWATQEELVLEATNMTATLLLAILAGSLHYHTPLTLARAVSVI